MEENKEGFEENEWIYCSPDEKGEERWIYQYFYDNIDDEQQSEAHKKVNNRQKDRKHKNEKKPKKESNIEIIDCKFPATTKKWIKTQYENFISINGLLDKQILKNIKKPTVIQIIPKGKKYHHTVFYDGEQLWDSWFDIYNIDNREYKIGNKFYKIYKKFYAKDIYDDPTIFKEESPQQLRKEGYCALFSLANARLKAKGEKLETMDKMLQAQKMKEELSTFAQIDSEMHVNGIKIFGL